MTRATPDSPTARSAAARGETHPDAIGRDDFRPDDLDPLAIDCSHVQQVVRARCGDDHGIGVLEQYSLGPHAPSGFTAFDDGAPG